MHGDLPTSEYAAKADIFSVDSGRFLRSGCFCEVVKRSIRRTFADYFDISVCTNSRLDYCSKVRNQERTSSIFLAMFLPHLDLKCVKQIR